MVFPWQCVDRGFGFDPTPPVAGPQPWGPSPEAAPPLPSPESPPALGFKKVPPPAMARGYRPQPLNHPGPVAPVMTPKKPHRVPLSFSQKLFVFFAFVSLSLVAAVAMKWALEVYWMDLF